LLRQFVNRVGHRRGTDLGIPPTGGPADAPATAVVACSRGFNANHPNAATSIRLGYCNGFDDIGIGYQLTPTTQLERAIESLESPIIFLSCYDFPELSKRARRLLKNTPHLIWVNPWFDDMEEFCSRRDLHDFGLPSDVYKDVLDSDANFLWAPCPPSAVEFFQLWISSGQRVEPLPLACDTRTYFFDSKETAFADVKLAFVGGYRPYKNVQYEKYLKPYEDELVVYGYNEWPYQGYRGQLPSGSERALYQNALLSPALSEPHAEYTGDIVERVFKILGCRGLAITDVNPFYKELFSEDELLVPASVAEYHELMRTCLTDLEFNQRYRDAGYKAVHDRHTYAHRAWRILSLLEMDNLLGASPSTTA